MKERYTPRFTEAKQVGIIYHFTLLRRLIEIEKNSFLLKSHGNTYISFTRDKQFPTRTIDWRSSSVRIVIDGDKLSNKYKIEPFRDKKALGGSRLDADEREERINKYHPRKGAININIKDYILSIDILKGTEWEHYKNTYEFKHLLERLKEDNIPYRFVTSFKEQVTRIPSSMLAQTYKPGETQLPEKVFLQPKLDGCFSGDTLIKIKDKITQNIHEVQIKDLEHCFEEYEIYSLNLYTKEFEYCDIENFLKRKLNKKWIEIELESGDKIKCTEDHLFLLTSGEWVEAKDLLGKELFTDSKFL